MLDFALYNQQYLVHHTWILSAHYSRPDVHQHRWPRDIMSSIPSFCWIGRALEGGDLVFLILLLSRVPSYSTRPNNSKHNQDCISARSNMCSQRWTPNVSLGTFGYWCVTQLTRPSHTHIRNRYETKNQGLFVPTNGWGSSSPWRCLELCRIQALQRMNSACILLH